MTVFRTVVPMPAAPLSGARLRHTDALTLLGSCFADQVGGRLHDAGHSTCINPLGVVYNPVSLGCTISRLARSSPVEREMTADELHWCERQGIHFSFHASTRHSHELRDECLRSLNEAIERGHRALRSSTVLYLTLGSAWAYTLRDSGLVVANCHRQPQDRFERLLLSVASIEESLRDAIEAARRLNPTLRVVLTVSPVRHWREGAVASSRSKAHLLTATHSVVDSMPRAVSYFPSYEILMDELRDYRWFEEDMIHPSKPAVDYVTSRLLEAHFDPSDEPLRDRCRAVRAASRHRHARPRSAASTRFMVQQKALRQDLQLEFPHLSEWLLEEEEGRREEEQPL